MASHEAPIVKELHATLQSIVTGIRIDGEHLIIEGVDAMPIGGPEDDGHPMMRTVATHIGNLGPDKQPDSVKAAIKVLSAYGLKWVRDQ